MALPLNKSKCLFALVDVNNMYVSCERVFNPNLNGKPVVVLSNNDGCAVSRSAEAKSLGIKMGEPWFKLKDISKKHGIIGLSSNYALYGDMSNRLVSVLREFTPTLEVYSIDESFLGLEGLDSLWPSRTELGSAIRKRVDTMLGLPVCVGIATTKTLSKLANHIAKKNPQYQGVCDLTAFSETELSKIFSKIDAGEVWGIGGRIAARLSEARILTVEDLRTASVSWIRKEFGVVVERTLRELNGVSCLSLEEVSPPRKQIVCSRSFGQMVSTIDELREAVTLYSTRAGEKLRAQGSVTSAITVFVMTNRFRANDDQYTNSITVCLANPSSSTIDLTSAALAGLSQIYKPGYQYKKAGVMLADISSASIKQGTLFDEEPVKQESSLALMKTLDGLNAKFGKDSLFVASKGVSAKWTMKSDNLSPNFTTRWDELPVAK